MSNDKNIQQSKTKWPYYVMATSLVFIGILLLLLPANFFDSGESVCLSQQLLGKDCIGCGLTKATMHLIHGDWREAVYHNSLSLLSTPTLAVVGSYLIYYCYQKIVKS